MEKLTENNPSCEILAVSRSNSFSKFSRLPNATFFEGDDKD